MQQGYRALIENIYFSVKIDRNYNEYFKQRLGYIMQNIKEKYYKNEEQIIAPGVIYQGGINRYPYGFHVLDENSEEIYPKYRIYFAHKVGDNFPVYVIVSAQYMHISGKTVEEIIKDTEKYIVKILMSIDNYYYRKKDTPYEFNLSRVDICNHTNKIDINKYIKAEEFNARVITRLKKVFAVFENVGHWETRLDYFRYGKSDLVVRFYNKTKEVCQMRYKQFFIPYWYEVGLIDKRTKRIFDLTYKFNKNYELDFLYSHLFLELGEDNLSDELKDHIVSLYENTKIDDEEKIEFYKNTIKKYKIKMAKEIINVEFQLRGSYLKGINLKDENEEVIELKNIFEIFNYMNEFYEYLTNNSFRVINPYYKEKGIKKRYRKKRIAPTDKVWEQIQNCKIINIKNKQSSNYKIYKTYTKDTNELDNFRKLNKNIANLLSNKINLSDFDYMSMDEIFQLLKNGYSDNSENYIKLLEKIERKLLLKENIEKE